MSNTDKAFGKHKAFIAFITCGDPDLDTTERAVRTALANGADIIELGIPFSDPTVEDIAVQDANIRALKGGIVTDDVFEFVKKLRRDITVPIVLVTYANVMFSYGIDKFAKLSAEVGVDGIMLPDVPFEEKKEFSEICQNYGVDFISIVAPTSGERIKMIAEDAKGYIYVMSCGSKERITECVHTVKKYAKVPCVIGYGINTAEQAEPFADIADGLAIGSGIVSIVAKYGKNSSEKIGELVRSMRDLLNG